MASVSWERESGRVSRLSTPAVVSRLEMSSSFTSLVNFAEARVMTVSRLKSVTSAVSST